jgi:hypothetical protein
MEAHADHAQHQAPTGNRFFRLGVLASYLAGPRASKIAWEPGQRERVLSRYVSLLDRKDWCAIAREGRAAGERGMSWLAGVPGLQLRAFASAQGE